jgi:hypothetical protein
MISDAGVALQRWLAPAGAPGQVAIACISGLTPKILIIRFILQASTCRLISVLRAKEIADFTDGAPEGVDVPDGAGSQKGLQFCESHLDRIEVGAIGRKE